MKPTVCVVSVGRTSRIIANVLAELTLPAEFVFKEALINGPQDIDGVLEACDVLFSSGHNARMLRKHLDKPLIGISPSLYDILLACTKAREFTDKPLLVTNMEALSAIDIAKIAGMLTVEIIHEKYDRTDGGIEEIILKHKAMGQECVIGSGMVCEFAEKHNIPSVYLFPDESIRNSLTTASAMAVSIFQKTAQNLHLASVINSSKTGIIMVNSAGNVFLSNPTARKYIGVTEEDLADANIAGLFDADSVDAIMTSSTRTHFFNEFGGFSYSIEVNPIVTRGEVIDRLVFIEDLNAIRNTEHEFRRNVWAQKGFTAKYSFGQYNSVDRNFLDFLSTAKNYAGTEEPVVILGETGVGKEVLAQSIHNHSKRAGKAFVAVNCAAIPESLLESELFGYSDGAFTGAQKGGKEGYFEMAHMGTVFLDEIGEMNVALQSKLLRIIQEKQVLRVGATKLIPFDARIIVATNKSLWRMVEEGTFRKDLYYRLNVLELNVPPLRERSDDTLTLFEDFSRRLSPPMWDSARNFSGELVALLSSYSWPGNVRELENFVRMLGAHWHPGMRPEELRALIVDMLEKKRVQGGAPAAQTSLPVREETRREAPVPSDRGILKSNEERQIRETLDICGGNAIKAAEILGIHRTTLWRKLKRLGLPAKEDSPVATDGGLRRGC